MRTVSIFHEKKKHSYYWEGGTCLESVGRSCAGAVCSGRGPVSDYDCRQANEKVNRYKEKIFFFSSLSYDLLNLTIF